MEASFPTAYAPDKESSPPPRHLSAASFGHSQKVILRKARRLRWPSLTCPSTIPSTHAAPDRRLELPSPRLLPLTLSHPSSSVLLLRPPPQESRFSGGWASQNDGIVIVA